MNRGRVLHITRDFPPRWSGGISTALRGIVHEQRREGFDVDVISFDAWRPRRANDYAPLPDSSTESEARAGSQGELRVWRVRDADSPDIIGRRILRGAYAQIEVHVAMLWPAAFEAAEQSETPIVYMAHVLSAKMDELRGLTIPSFSAEAERIALSQASKVIVPAAHLVNALRESVAATLEHRPLPLVEEDIPDLVPFSERRWDIAYSARFSDIKQSLPAFDTIALFLETVPGSRALVIGGLPESPKTERKLLERWRATQPAEILERIDFVGWKSRPEALELYAQSRVFLSTSQIETWGLAVAEALRCGCAVVASAIEAHREQRALGGDIALVAFNDSAASWSAALIQAHRNA